MDNEREIICTICPKSCRIKVSVSAKNGQVSVKGHMCKRGADYAREEALDPKRTITSTVIIQDAMYPVVSVRTDKPVPRTLIFDCMDLIKKVTVHAPVKTGDIVIKNILDTGADVIITKDMS